MKLRVSTMALALALVASDAAAADAGAQGLPSGHPPVSPNTDAGASSAPTRPPGHPSVADEADDEEEPHGHGHGMPPVASDSDGAQEDDTLPAGTIEALILDPEGTPLKKSSVTLGILQTSVAKGENRRRIFKETDDRGVVRFADLETGSGYAYRVSVTRDLATFAVPPFQLNLQKGTRAKLHVFPVVSDMQQAQIGAQAILYMELKDDRIQVQEMLTIFNIGKTAWVPQNMMMRLPAGFTALTASQTMSDTGIDPVEKTGARLRGTFAPGKHVVEFRWQYPYGGEKEIDVDVELPPKVVAARVLVPASQQMKLSVDGFPAAQPVFDPQGQRILQTQRALQSREDPEIKRLHVSLRDLPTEGPARFVVTALAGAVAFGAIAAALRLRGERSEPKGGKKADREKLLEELAELERARKAGDVGPKTYERARRELIDALARTFLKSEPRGA